ncbi:MAG: hypothetical protein H6739_03185 [Alphaproteobacteria bacterium]|nr:hypothetical protein [Alphaproteobacteria bacterium]
MLDLDPPLVLTDLEDLLEAGGPLPAEALAEVLRAVAASPELAGLEDPWREDGGPAGWHAGLEHLLSCVEDPDAGRLLASLLDELPPLMQGTLALALLDHGLADVAQVGDQRLPLIAAHGVRQLEFDERWQLKETFHRALGVLQAAWPDRWGPALAQAAAEAEDLCFDVWPPIRDLIAPHATPAQRVQIAAHHTAMEVPAGVPRFGLRQAIALVSGAGDEGIRAADAFTARFRPGDEMSRAELLTASVVRATLYAEAGEIMEDTDPDLWWTVSRNVDPVELMEVVTPLLPALPVQALAASLPFGGVRLLAHPDSGDTLHYSPEGQLLRITWMRAGTSTSTAELWQYDSADDVIEGIHAHAQERIAEGWGLPGQRAAVAPVMDAVFEGARDMRWRPGHDELLLATAEGLVRMNGALEVTARIPVAGGLRAVDVSPDGRWLALRSDATLSLCDASTGQVRWSRAMRAWQTACAWDLEGGTLSVLNSQTWLATFALDDGVVRALRTRLNSVNDDLCAVSGGRLLVVAGGARAALLAADTLEVRARGPVTGNTTSRAWAGRAVWAESCDAMRWQDVSGEGFAAVAGQLRLTEGPHDPQEPDMSRVLFYELAGGSSDGRFMLVSGADSYGRRRSLAVVDLDAGRHVLLARAGGSETLCQALMEPGRPWLLACDGAQLYALDLRAQDFERTLGVGLCRMDAPARSMIPDAEAPYPGGALPAKLSPAQRDSVQRWVQTPPRLAPPAAWTALDGGGPPRPALVAPRDSDDPLASCSSGVVLAPLVVAGPGATRALLGAARDRLARLQALAVQVLGENLSDWLEGVARMLEEAGDAVVIPWVWDPATGETFEADPDAGPFGEGWTLAEAGDGFDGFDDASEPAGDPGAQRARLDRVLRWAGLGGLNGLRASILDLAARWRRPSLDKPLFTDHREPLWSTEVCTDDMTVGDTLVISAVLEKLDQAREVTDADLLSSLDEDDRRLAEVLSGYDDGVDVTRLLLQGVELWGEDGLSALLPRLARLHLGQPLSRGEVEPWLRGRGAPREDAVRRFLQGLGLHAHMEALGFPPVFYDEDDWSMEDSP